MKSKIESRLPILMAMQKPPISQAQLIRDLGLGPNTVSRLYHNSFTRLDRETIDKLLTYFDCNLSDLFAEPKEK